MGERSHLFLKGLFESVVPKHLIIENSLVLEFIPHAALSPRPPAKSTRGLSASCYFNPARLSV